MPAKQEGMIFKATYSGVPVYECLIKGVSKISASAQLGTIVIAHLHVCERRLSGRCDAA